MRTCLWRTTLHSLDGDQQVTSADGPAARSDRPDVIVDDDNCQNGSTLSSSMNSADEMTPDDSLNPEAQLAMEAKSVTKLMEAMTMAIKCKRIGTSLKLFDGLVRSWTCFELLESIVKIVGEQRSTPVYAVRGLIDAVSTALPSCEMPVQKRIELLCRLLCVMCGSNHGPRNNLLLSRCKQDLCSPRGAFTYYMNPEFTVIKKTTGRATMPASRLGPQVTTHVSKVHMPGRRHEFSSKSHQRSPVPGPSGVPPSMNRVSGPRPSYRPASPFGPETKYIRGKHTDLAPDLKQTKPCQIATVHVLEDEEDAERLNELARYYEAELLEAHHCAANFDIQDVKERLTQEEEAVISAAAKKVARARSTSRKTRTPVPTSPSQEILAERVEEIREKKELIEIAETLEEELHDSIHEQAVLHSIGQLKVEKEEMAAAMEAYVQENMFTTDEMDAHALLNSTMDQEELHRQEIEFARRAAEFPAGPRESSPASGQRTTGRDVGQIISKFESATHQRYPVPGPSCIPPSMTRVSWSRPSYKPASPFGPETKYIRGQHTDLAPDLTQTKPRQIATVHVLEDEEDAERLNELARYYEAELLEEHHCAANLDIQDIKERVAQEEEAVISAAAKKLARARSTSRKTRTPVSTSPSQEILAERVEEIGTKKELIEIAETLEEELHEAIHEQAVLHGIGQLKVEKEEMAAAMEAYAQENMFTTDEMDAHALLDSTMDPEEFRRQEIDLARRAAVSSAAVDVDAVKFMLEEELAQTMESLRDELVQQGRDLQVDLIQTAETLEEGLQEVIQEERAAAFGAWEREPGVPKVALSKKTTKSIRKEAVSAAASREVDHQASKRSGFVSEKTAALEKICDEPKVPRARSMASTTRGIKPASHFGPQVVKKRR